MSEKEPLDWKEIISVNPGTEKGQHNTDRKSLLKPGVYIDLSRATAESWIPALKIRRETAEKTAEAQGHTLSEQNASVRVTVISIPEETRTNPIDGKIVVEADGGVQSEIFASVFYNCIGREDDTFSGIFVTKNSLLGYGDALPARGEGSHSRAHRPRNG